MCYIRLEIEKGKDLMTAYAFSIVNTADFSQVEAPFNGSKTVLKRRKIKKHCINPGWANNK